MNVIALGDRRLRFGELQTEVDGISGKVFVYPLRTWAEAHLDEVHQARESYDDRKLSGS